MQRPKTGLGEKMHKKFQFLVFCNAFDPNNGMKLSFFGKKLIGRTVLWHGTVYYPTNLISGPLAWRKSLKWGKLNVCVLKRSSSRYTYPKLLKGFWLGKKHQSNCIERITIEFFIGSLHRDLMNYIVGVLVYSKLNSNLKYYFQRHVCLSIRCALSVCVSKD